MDMDMDITATKKPNTLVVNLYGGPGTGKSTTRAKVFSSLKEKGVNIEEVIEHAKDMVWEERSNILEDQLYILAKQARRVHRLLGKVDIVITDSPLVLSSYYAKQTSSSIPEHLITPIVTFLREEAPQMDIFLNRFRSRKYNPVGRLQTEEQAIVIDGEIKEFLRGVNANQSDKDSYIEADAGDDTFIVNMISQWLLENN